MKRFAPALMLAAFAVPASAQQAPVKNPSQVESGTYKVEPNHTIVLFKVMHFGFTDYYGEINDVTGALKLDAKAPDSSAVEIKASTASVETKSPKLANELKGPQWLDAAKFPDITFKSTKVAEAGPNAAKITGELTIHGVTKPITLDATFVGAGPNPLSKAYTVGFEAKGTIKRSDFGVKTLVPLVADDVGLIISAAFEKQS